jgi:uncharacterized protein
VTPEASPTIDPECRRREAALVDRLRRLSSLVVAFSGGVDSAYLAWAAARELGSRMLAVTADSPSYPERHRQLALATVRQFGFPHEIIGTDELAQPAYRVNDVDRCYHCKRELYTRLTQLARERGYEAVADGSNADDRGDYRPGRTAAREFGVVSPLDEAGLTKADIRALAHQAGLPIWDEPASACLSSRIPYHSEVTDGKLRLIEAAEEALRALGFRIVRVRHYGETARVEIGRDELARALDSRTRQTIDQAVRNVGFRDVLVDPAGYRRGSLNEGVRLEPV